MCEIIEINGVKYSPLSEQAKSVDGLTPVLIRSYAAGVHFGLLEKEEFTISGKVVVLRNTRRVWSWKKAASLSQIAIDGVGEGSKIAMALDYNEIVNVIETIPLTETAFKNLKNHPEWKS